MSYFKWENILKTHIFEIDEQHKKLIDLTNELYDAIQKGVAAEIEKQTLIEICDYVKYHFATEEKYLMENNLEEYQHHKKQHSMLIDKMSNILKHYTPENIDIPNQIFDVLRYWVVQHIKKNDSKYLK